MVSQNKSTRQQSEKLAPSGRRSARSKVDKDSYKFAYDLDQRIFALKKVLPAGMAFPYDFGFLPPDHRFGWRSNRCPAADGAVQLNGAMHREFQLREEIVVHAPVERCFLLSTSVEIVERELGMHPVRGRTSGLVVEGDTVRWEGWQLGLPQFHESLIDVFHPLVFFRDRMIAGRFARFEHDHHFTDRGDRTVLLWDELRFTMRWGWIGTFIGQRILVPHIRGLMRKRFTLLKEIAEGDEWHSYLSKPHMVFSDGDEQQKAARSNRTEKEAS
jgi:ligand-binding SRPBCC domain-containing protein